MEQVNIYIAIVSLIVSIIIGIIQIIISRKQKIIAAEQKIMATKIGEVTTIVNNFKSSAVVQKQASGIIGNNLDRGSSISHNVLERQ